MTTIEAKPGAALRLGYAGEHLARQIRFDIRDWRALYGDGWAELVYQPEWAEKPYLIAREQTADEVLWEIQHSDARDAGSGECQLLYLVGDRVVKREIWITEVEPSLGEPGDPPTEAEKSWLGQVTQTASSAREAEKKAKDYAGQSERSAARADEHAKAASNSARSAAELAASISGVTVAAVDLPEGSGATVSKTYPFGRDGPMRLTFGIPAGKQGEKGDKGDSFTYEDFTEDQLAKLKGDPGYTPVKGVDYFDGDPGYTPVKGVDYWTAADKDEITAAVLAALPVYDGEVEYL